MLLALAAATGSAATDRLDSPRTLRVGLATDLDTVDLCCDARVRVATREGPVPLDRSIQVAPDSAVQGDAVYRLQVAALKDERQARSLAAFARRETSLPSDAIFDADRDLYRVRVGRFSRRAEAEAAKGRLAAVGLDGGWVVSEGGRLRAAALSVRQGERVIRVEGRWLHIDAPRDVGIPFGRGRYRTRLLVYLNDRGKLNVINELALEDYLRGVVPREMGPELYNEVEALKAQAVAARTFTLRNLGEFRGEGYDICATPRCQVFGGMGSEHPRSDRAIRETAGEVMVIDGDLAETFYTATCGGHTENVEVMFPQKKGRHLRGVPCIESGGARLGDHQGPERTFPDGLTQHLLPPAPGRPTQVLSARTEHLALLAGLRLPRDRLGSLARGELRRYLLSVLDLMLDPRFLTDAAHLARLLEQPPAGWRPPDRRLANYLYESGLLAPPMETPVSAAQIESLLFELAIYLGVIRFETADFLALDGENLHLRRTNGERTRIPRPERLVTFGRRGDDLRSSPLEVMAGDHLELFWHRERLLAIVQPRPAPTVAFGKRNVRGRWRELRTPAQLRSSVQTRYPGFPYSDFQVLSRGASGRVGSIRLLGDDGRSVLVDGLAIRWTLGLADTWFQTERRGEDTLFTGRGWGHGVGLCQAGAFGMAMRGNRYREILDHYYSGIALERLSD